MNSASSKECRRLDSSLLPRKKWDTRHDCIVVELAIWTLHTASIAKGSNHRHWNNNQWEMMKVPRGFGAKLVVLGTVWRAASWGSVKRRLLPQQHCIAQHKIHTSSVDVARHWIKWKWWMLIFVPFCVMVLLQVHRNKCTASGKGSWIMTL